MMKKMMLFSLMLSVVFRIIMAIANHSGSSTKASTTTIPLQQHSNNQHGISNDSANRLLKKTQNMGELLHSFE